MENKTFSFVLDPYDELQIVNVFNWIKFNY